MTYYFFQEATVHYRTIPTKRLNSKMNRTVLWAAHGTLVVIKTSVMFNYAQIFYTLD